MEVSPAIPPRLTTGTEPGNLHDTTDAARTTKPIMLPAGFSFIIDDVDGDIPEEDAEDRGRPKTPASGDPSGVSQQQDEAARVEQIKGEAESRKNEFAKLLEEHAQVVKELKKMEDEPLQS